MTRATLLFPASVLRKRLSKRNFQSSPSGKLWGLAEILTVRSTGNRHQILQNSSEFRIVRTSQGIAAPEKQRPLSTEI
jgi:hypothetical protein